MSKPRDSIVGPLKDKLPDVDSSDELNDQVWTTAEIGPDEEFTLEIQLADEDARQDVLEEMERLGISAGADYGQVVRTRATAEEVFDVAGISDVEKVFENIPDKLHNTSEGVSVSNADTVQNNQSLTGSGVKAAIIDLSPQQGSGFWPDTHKKYGANVVDTIGSGADDGSYFVENSQRHGTGCTEIVYDMAPDADLVLCAMNGSDSDGTIPSMLKKLEQRHPDTAVVSVSLGSAPTSRLDGLDSISNAMDKFTTEGETVSDPANVGSTAERGRVIAVSAGNEADGNTWHGTYTDSGDGTMTFENGNSYLQMDNAEDGVFVIANWDSWDEAAGQTYSIALYEDSSKSTQIASSDPQDNWVYLQVPGTSAGDTIYLEVTKEGASRDHEFDIWLWGNRSMKITNDTSARSISLPATAQDSQTLTTAAIQATDFGAEPNAGDVKVYSSRGPTRDGRDGVNISGPSRVSQTDQGYGTADFNNNPAKGFNGTSAAAPHIAGAATQLFEISGATHTDVAQALKSTGAGIPDSNFDKSDSTVVGGGYLDVAAAADSFTSTPTERGTSPQLGGDAQFNTPAIDSNQIYVGGLQNTFFAISRSDLESEGWDLPRGNKAGLSDSSGYIWTVPDQNVIFFGSGQGKLHAVETDDATEYWSGEDIPDVGSAITSTPTSDSGNIYAGTNDGRVLAWDGETAGSVFEVFVDGAVYSDLAAANGRVYVTTANGTLHVLDGSNGSDLWKEDTFADFRSSSPTLGGGSVYVAADELYEYDAADNKNNTRTTSGFGGTAGSNPTYYNGSVYVGSADGDLYAYNASDGSEEWTYSTQGVVASTPAVDTSNDYIAITSTDGFLHMIDLSGTQLDTTSIPAGTRASPVIDNGQLFVPTADGTVYAFE